MFFVVVIAVVIDLGEREAGTWVVRALLLQPGQKENTTTTREKKKIKFMPSPRIKR